MTALPPFLPAAAATVLDASLFFPAGSRPKQPLQGHGVVVHGARAVGKTSLAFQAAINITQQSTQDTVVVLCQESTFYAKVPQSFTPLSALSESALGRIEFVYVESWAAALRELMELRTTQAVPSLLLMDDDGFEVESASHRTGRQRGQQPHPDTAAATAAAACLSYLEGIHDWMTRNGKPFRYVLVTNQIPESATQLALPYAAFPLVNVWMGASGTVLITPLVSDAAQVPPAQVTWANGLQLR